MPCLRWGSCGCWSGWGPGSGGEELLECDERVDVVIAGGLDEFALHPPLHVSSGKQSAAGTPVQGTGSPPRSPSPRKGTSPGKSSAQRTVSGKAKHPSTQRQIGPPGHADGLAVFATNALGLPSMVSTSNPLNSPSIRGDRTAHARTSAVSDLIINNSGMLLADGSTVTVTEPGSSVSYSCRNPTWVTKMSVPRSVCGD